MQRSIRLALATLLLVLAACSKVTQENFDKVADGMTKDQVIAILGDPTESSSMSVVGVSGTTAKWVDKAGTITIRFVNDKVRLKSFDKPEAH